MANDFLMNPATGDWWLQDGEKVNLCENIEDLTRQRVSITLKTFLGEWFANKDFGLPYFQSIYGKGTKAATDVAIKNTIASVEGISKLLFYKSEINKQERVLTVSFKALSNSGKIIVEEDLQL